jgi:dTDP-N-acetylfucosamine:lipid II N-acetylfucosaminyltransferase
MPRSEYCEILYSCSHVIMGHLRSEGCGNIFRAIAYGAKVFLDDKNLFYKFLKIRGFVIYSHKHLSAAELNTDLSRLEIDLNRNLLMKYFNEDQLKLEYNNLLSL